MIENRHQAQDDKSEEYLLGSPVIDGLLFLFVVGVALAPLVAFAVLMLIAAPA